MGNSPKYMNIIYMLERKFQYIRQISCFTNSTNYLMRLSNLLHRNYGIILNCFYISDKAIV